LLASCSYDAKVFIWKQDAQQQQQQWQPIYQHQSHSASGGEMKWFHNNNINNIQ
jgi:hypothetical protein